MTNQRFAIIGLLFLCGTWPAIAAAKNPTTVKFEDTVRVLKSHQDPGPKDFATVGSDVDNVLVDLVGNRKVDADIRARAARALGFYPGPGTRAVLMNAMSTHDVEVEVRCAAMLGMARAFKEEVVEDLKAYLRGGDPDLRCGAASALAEIGGDRVRIFMIDAIDHENILEVRIAMEKALKRMLP